MSLEEYNIDKQKDTQRSSVVISELLYAFIHRNQIPKTMICFLFLVHGIIKTRTKNIRYTSDLNIPYS